MSKPLFNPEETIIELCVRIEAFKATIKEQTDDMNNLKEEVRGLMIENDLKPISNELFKKIMVSIPKSFDIVRLKMYHKDLAKEFIKEEIKTTTIDVITKEAKAYIKKNYPKVWEDINAEGTPHLTIKWR